ncbi:hypothetical protein BS78_08G073100 [Paspalum vaginatum]|nr:hypothetical protein BS78_08G073100 [Paspalum vaginatum]
MSWGAAAWGLQKATELVSGANAWAELFNRISSLISSHSQRLNIHEQLDNNEDDQQPIQDNLRQLQTDLQQLQTTLPKMHDLIERLEWQIHKKAAAELLPHIKDAVYDAEDLLDEFNYYELKVKVEERANEWQSLPALKEFIYSVIQGNFNRVKESQHKLDHLYYQSRDLCFQISRLKFDKVIRPETSSFLSETKILGRDDEVNKVLELLGVATHSNASYKRKRANSFGVLPIVGLGGVGKTTLAQQICNDRRVKSYFNMIPWTCVSDEFAVKRLTKEIIQYLRKEVSTDNLNSLQTILSNIVDSKRFLLVLDDIWDDVLENDGQEWQRFCAPLSNALPESMILVTTRSLRVADKVRTVDAFHLDGLKEDVFWEFFKVQAFGSDNLDKKPELENIGKSLIPKLKGSPLAAKTIGRLLRMNLNPEHWNNILNSELWELEQEKTDILPALRLSYMYLPAHLKRCFSFCAAYPKDYAFEKHVLAMIWVAQGFVQRQLTSVGCQYFEELVSRSFFQRAPIGIYTYVIHDLMHDMAQLVSRDECFIIKDASDIQRIPPNVRHLSILTRSIDCQDLVGLSKYKKLRTLLCNTAFHQDVFATAIRSWFSELRHIRMLSSVLPRPISEIPDSIGHLKLLRFLCFQSKWQVNGIPAFNGNLKLQALPSSFGCLYNLHIVDASECTFQSVPTDFRNLVSLQKFKSMNFNYFLEGSFLHFQVQTGQVIAALKHINEIKRKLRISISFQETIVAELNKDKQLYSFCISLSGVRLASCGQEILEAFEVLRPDPDLKYLEVTGYQGVDFCPSWLLPENLPNLVTLTFKECCNIMDASFSRLFCKGFQFIAGICISKCRKLSSLSLFLQPDFIPAIKRMSIDSCEELVSLSAERFGDLCHLEELEICQCPNINWQKLVALPSSLRKLTLIQFGTFVDHFVTCLLGINSLVLITLWDSSLTSIPLQLWTNNLPTMEKLDCIDCENLTSFRGSDAIFNPYHRGGNTSNGQTFKSLTEITIENCNRLSSLQDLFTTEYLPVIRKIHVKNCLGLLSLAAERLGGFSFLEDLEIRNCPKLIWQRGLVLPPSLARLCLARCGDVSEWFPCCLSNLTFLTNLHLSELFYVVSIPGDIWRNNLPSLEHLVICSCEDLKSIGGPEEISYINNVHIYSCRWLSELHKPSSKVGSPSRNW